MTNFEKITASPEALVDFLESIPSLEGPWDDDFHRQYCDPCGAANCFTCPHEAERNNPAWWLAQETEGTVAQGNQNKNWSIHILPKDCRSLFVCMDTEIFDRWVKNGVIPLHDDRDSFSSYPLPCFIGYAATTDPKALDILAGISV